MGFGLVSATSATACSRSTARRSTTRRTSAPWPPSTPRPGGIRWVATYPRRTAAEAGPGRERDLNPAIVHDGLVIVAPDDAASIYAFDAGSGRLVWKTDPLPEEVKLAHLLGVAKGRLVATGDRVLLFDVKTGKLLHTWPDSGRAFEGYGRGLLAGDQIYWPTRTEIHVLDQATGLRGRAADQAPGDVPDDRRQPRRRRRLPDRRPDRRAWSSSARTAA